MLHAMQSQMKLAKMLAKKTSNKGSSAKSDIDIPISSEMIELLNMNKVDENGYLSEYVASMLTQPLNSMALFNPTAAVVSSNYTASRPPMSSATAGFEISVLSGSPHHHSSSRGALRHRNLDQFDDTSNSAESSSAISSLKSRLESLWLRRQATLAHQDGNVNEAVDFLQQAIEEHLGTPDYLAANLAQPTLSSNPLDLLNEIRAEFLIYDEPIHRKASRIQRFLHKKYLRKCYFAASIQRYFRGFLTRKKLWKLKEIRNQCSKLIQRRFRRHLKRMHKLATKIKQWYKIRKIVQEYQRRLRIYRAARNIQRIYRGYRGRMRAYAKRRFLEFTEMVQKNVRGYLTRRDRSFALLRYHRLFFIAARKIQLAVRKIQAVQRSQIKLLLELAKENIRDRKEKIIVHETVRMSKLRNRLYVKSAAGRIHVQFVLRRMKVRNSILSANIAAATSSTGKYEAVNHEDVTRVMEVLDSFDEDGTGYISSSRLQMLLQRLCIPADLSTVSEIVDHLDREGNGYINFTDLVDWYMSEAADDVVDPVSTAGNLEKTSLLLRRGVRTMLRSSLRAAEKMLINEESARLTRKTTAEFRAINAPKYQCCQCQRPFVLFTDYYTHFDLDSGNCTVLNQKGLFFPKYWIKQDWRNQRQIEREIIRLNDEVQCVQHAVARKMFASFAENRHPEVKAFVAQQELRARTIYCEKFLIEQPSPNNMKTMTCSLLREVLAVADLSNISVPVIDCALAQLRLPMNSQWVANESCSFQEVEKWVGKFLSNEKIKGKDANFTDSSMGVESGDLLKNFQSNGDPNILPTLYHSIVSKTLSAVALPPVTAAGKVSRFTRNMAAMRVHSLRAQLIEVEAALLALAEFREKRPNRIAVDDDNLVLLGLMSCSRFHYNKIWTSLTSRYVTITNEYIQLYSATIPKWCDLSRLLCWRKYEKVNPFADVSASEVFEHRVAEARIRSSASTDYFLGRRFGCINNLGTSVQRQIAHRLHAFRALLREDVELRGSDQLGGGGDVLHYWPTTTCTRLDSAFVFETLTSNSLKIDDVIQRIDVDLLEEAMCTARLEKDALDSSYSGDIHLAALQDWATSEKFRPFVRASKLLRQTARLTHNAIVGLFFDGGGAQWQLSDARRVLTINERKSSRLSLLLVDAICNAHDVGNGDFLTHLQNSYLSTELQSVTTPIFKPIAQLSSNESSKTAGASFQQQPVVAAVLFSSSSSSAAGAVDETALSTKIASGVGVENNLASEKFTATSIGAVPSFRMRSLYENWGVFSRLREYSSYCEDSVIYNRIEARAQTRLMLNWFNRHGRYHLWTERVLARSAGAAMNTAWCLAAQCCVGGEVARVPQHIHELSFSICVAQFDSESCGSLTHQQIACLFRCLWLDPSDKHIYFAFPQLQQVNQRFVALKEVVNYLQSAPSIPLRSRIRAFFSAFSASTNLHDSAVVLLPWSWSHMRTALLLLVSAERRLARKQAESSVEFSADHASLVLVNDPTRTMHSSLIINSQILAVRQVTMFLKTTHGQIKLYQYRAVVKTLRNILLRDQCTSPALLRYACALHAEGTHGLLVTELPCVVQFLVKRFSWKPSPLFASQVGSSWCSVSTRKDIYWLSVEEAIALLKPCFLDSTTTATSPPRRSVLSLTRLRTWRWLRGDAVRKMTATARQQAVLISMRFQNAAVQETNYRCSVLGMWEVIRTVGKNVFFPSLFSAKAMPNAAILDLAVNTSAMPAATTIDGFETSFGTAINNAPVFDIIDKVDAVPSDDRKLFTKFYSGKNPAFQVNWKCVPREATALLLLSRGFSVSDLYDVAVQQLVASSASAVSSSTTYGSLDTTSVSVQHLYTCAHQQIYAKFSINRKIAVRTHWLVAGPSYYHEYCTVVDALARYPELINKCGSEFLKELIAGVSHSTL